MVTEYVHEFADLALKYGTPVVFLVIALESLGVPLPGETLLIAIGTAAGLKGSNILPLFVAAWTGAFLGDNIGYAIGRRFGRRAITRFGSSFALTETRIKGLEQKFSRYGILVVAGARFVVPLRQLNGAIAGSLRMPWWRFAFANAVGAALWVGVWLILSARLSHVVDHLGKMHGLGIVILAVAAIAAGFWLWRTIRAGRPSHG